MLKRILIPATLVLAILMLLLIGWIFWNSPGETNDPASYSLLLRRLGYPDNEGIAFFPASIPTDAEAPQLHYQPGMLQGGTTLHLSYTIDAALVEDHAAQYAALSAWVGPITDAPDAIRSHSFLRNLPDSATLYVLYAKPYQEGSWNHGETRLVAISGTRILFQYDRW